ncbi:MAG: hypothetical protein ACC742_13920 [Thermoanaerobaculales bacterium]
MGAQRVKGSVLISRLGFVEKQFGGAESPRIIEEECRARSGDVCRYRVTWM